MATRYDRQIARAVRYAEGADVSPSHVPPRRVRSPRQTGVLPIKNVSGETIPANSLVMQKSGIVSDSSYYEVVKITSSTLLGGANNARMFAVQEELANNGFGYGIVDGWARLRVIDSEVSSMLDGFTIHSVSPSLNSFQVTTNLGAFRTRYVATKAQLWESGESPFLVDAMMQQSRISDRLSIWGEIVSTGPAGEPDYTDYRYFFDPYRAGPTFKRITVYNSNEYLEFGIGSSNTHFVPPKTPVVVGMIGSSPSGLMYGFSLPVPMVFDMIVTAVTGTNWNTQTVTGKTFDARNGAAYGPSRTILTAAVPANVINSFPMLAVNDRCVCVLFNTSGPSMTLIAKSGMAMPNTYTTIAPGLAATIAAN